MGSPWIIEGRLDKAETVECLREYGICLMPGLLANYMQGMNEEFERAFQDPDPALTSDCPLPDARILRFMRNDQILARMPVTRAAFFNDVNIEVSEAYFRSPATMNCEFIFNDNVERPGRSGENFFGTHYDRLHTVKWYVYLKDTDPNCGPFEAAPGSHHRNLRRRIDWAMARGAMDPYDTLISEPEEHMVPMCGPAGTVLMFDSDISHRAGWVRPGHMRRVVRSHNFSQTYTRLVYNKESVEQVGGRDALLRHF